MGGRVGWEEPAGEGSVMGGARGERCCDVPLLQLWENEATKEQLMSSMGIDRWGTAPRASAWGRGPVGGGGDEG